MIIRSENTSDIEVITDITKAAFEDRSFSLNTEHFTIQDLRADGALTVSLVAEVDGRIVGYIAFSPVTISDGTKNWYNLGPVAIVPEFQGRRIGTILVNSGLTLLKSMSSEGIVLIGLPAYFSRFGFWSYPQLINDGTPQEVFLAMSLTERIPNGTVDLHKAFKQLSIIEKDAIAEVIIDYAIAGIKVDLEDPAIESLIDKGILSATLDGKVMMHPSALTEYDSYLAQVGQFRATEMSRVHKNPIMAAIKYGSG
ncbi:GNAT family N-acetyltransferase [Desulfopila sp. IMCC35008]|uniref:GNAT family N-acetyltransferase n=1 Tax=Desulfopila sp. IMCC35008 TaxID=2653858 RepID=UPI0013D5A025|nr:N-acetyltransferase [Desulfopila sp. IMCC35008]